MQLEPQPPAFLVDIPLCTTTALPDFNRGYVERYAHYEPPTSVGRDLIPAERLTSRTVEREDQTAIKVTRSDLDDAQRSKRAECATCRYDASCEGVWNNYLRRYGWDEFRPVPA
jgi:cyclic pyranopterin phosphate synthase